MSSHWTSAHISCLFPLFARRPQSWLHDHKVKNTLTFQDQCIFEMHIQSTFFSTAAELFHDVLQHTVCLRKFSCEVLCDVESRGIMAPEEHQADVPVAVFSKTNLVSCLCVTLLLVCRVRVRVRVWRFFASILMNNKTRADRKGWVSWLFSLTPHCLCSSMEITLNILPVLYLTIFCHLCWCSGIFLWNLIWQKWCKNTFSPSQANVLVIEPSAVNGQSARKRKMLCITFIYNFFVMYCVYNQNNLGDRTVGKRSFF